MIADSHAHVISGDFDRYPAAPLSGTLDRRLDDPMTAERLLRDMDAAAVRHAVLVQRAHVYGYDNRYVCDIADHHPERFVAVCCIDAAADDAVDRARHWLIDRRAAGLRLTEPFKGANLDWFAGRAAAGVWEVAAGLNASICLHMYRWNRIETLLALRGIAVRHPSVPVVLDHVSNLIAEQGPPTYGIDEPLAALADLPNVYLKVTTINLEKLRARELPSAPVISQVVATFGAHRVMWGSDVGQSGGTYGELLKLGLDSAGGLDVAARNAVMHDTTMTVYGKRWRSA